MPTLCSCRAASLCLAASSAGNRSKSPRLAIGLLWDEKRWIHRRCTAPGCIPARPPAGRHMGCSRRGSFRVPSPDGGCDCGRFTGDCLSCCWCCVWCGGAITAAWGSPCCIASGTSPSSASCARAGRQRMAGLSGQQKQQANDKNRAAQSRRRARAPAVNPSCRIPSTVCWAALSLELQAATLLQSILQRHNAEFSLLQSGFQTRY